MKLIVAICGLLTLPVLPNPHKFENGFVERTMSVIVRSDTAYVEYSVGLNETTLADVLSKWKTAAAGNIHTAAESASENSATPIESHLKLPESADRSAANQLTQPDSKRETPAASVNPSAASSDELEDSGSHAIDSDLLEEFRQLAISEIPQRLTITLDGKPVVATTITEGVAPRHPFTITIKFQFKIPETKSSVLLIEDNNFLEQTGAVRYSLKASGGAMLLRSNVAPVLGRSERVELENLSKSERTESTLIEARLAIVPAKKD